MYHIYQVERNNMHDSEVDENMIDGKDLCSSSDDCNMGSPLSGTMSHMIETTGGEMLRLKSVESIAYSTLPSTDIVEFNDSRQTDDDNSIRQNNSADATNKCSMRSEELSIRDPPPIVVDEGDDRIVPFSSSMIEHDRIDSPPIVEDEGESHIVQFQSSPIEHDRIHNTYSNAMEQKVLMIEEENKVKLIVENLYNIVERLQMDHKKSASKIDKMHSERKKAWSLKLIFIVLVCFALLIALSNIGTSFLVATFAKEIEISSNNEIVSTVTGSRVSTTSKIVSFTMNPSDIGFNDAPLRSRRKLTQRMLQDFCPSPDEGNNSTAIRCNFIGTIASSSARDMYKAFCPGWPSEQYCNGAGAPFVHLSCDGVITKIYGGTYIASSPPNNWISREEYTIYPSPAQGYLGEQAFSRGRGLGVCTVDFDLGMYCPQDKSPCLVFAAYQGNRCRNSTIVCNV